MTGYELHSDAEAYHLRHSVRGRPVQSPRKAGGPARVPPHGEHCRPCECIALNRWVAKGLGDPADFAHRNKRNHIGRKSGAAFHSPPSFFRAEWSCGTTKVTKGTKIFLSSRSGAVWLRSPLQTGRADFPHPASSNGFDEGMHSESTAVLTTVASRGVATGRRRIGRPGAGRAVDSGGAGDW